MTSGPAVRGADAAGAFRDVLQRSGAEVLEFALDPLDRTQVPVHSASAFLPGGRAGHGVGTGEDPAAAQAAALGRCVALLAAASPPALVRARGGDPGTVDPLDLILPAGSRYEEGDPRKFCRATRLPDGGEVLVPVEWVVAAAGDLPPGYRPTIAPGPGGLGVGLSWDDALESGLRDLVQADGASVASRALDPGRVVDVALPSPAPGIRPILKAAINDLGLANVCVVGEDDLPLHGLSVTAIGEAAAPDREDAVAAALRAFCLSRARKAFEHGSLEAAQGLAPPRYLELVTDLDPGDEEPQALAAMLDWLGRDDLREVVEPLFAQTARVALDELPHEPGRTTAELLAQRGFEVLAVDLTPPDSGDVVVLRAVVPGLEADTMASGRCGPRNLARLLERDLGLVGLGRAPEGTLPLRLRRGRAWLSPARVREVVGDLLPLYREPGRHAAALALARTR